MPGPSHRHRQGPHLHVTQAQLDLRQLLVQPRGAACLALSGCSPGSCQPVPWHCAEPQCRWSAPLLAPYCQQDGWQLLSRPCQLQQQLQQEVPAGLVLHLAWREPSWAQCAAVPPLQGAWLMAGGPVPVPGWLAVPLALCVAVRGQLEWRVQPRGRLARCRAAWWAAATTRSPPRSLDAALGPAPVAWLQHLCARSCVGLLRGAGRSVQALYECQRADICARGGAMCIAAAGQLCLCRCTAGKGNRAGALTPQLPGPAAREYWADDAVWRGPHAGRMPPSCRGLWSRCPAGSTRLPCRGS